MKRSPSQSTATIRRRDLLASASAAAAGFLMTHEAAGQQNPAENVQDRGSSLRIKGLQAYRAGGKVY